jgi:hypothetical protein
MPAVLSANRMVAGLVDVHLDNYKKSGAELVMGSGRFIGPKTIEISLATAVAAFRGSGLLSTREPVQ